MEEEEKVLLVWSLCPSNLHMERDSCHSEYFMRFTQCHTFTRMHTHFLSVRLTPCEICVDCVLHTHTFKLRFEGKKKKNLCSQQVAGAPHSHTKKHVSKRLNVSVR